MIINLWRKLFGGCGHHWTVIRDGGIVNDDGVQVGHYYYSQCYKCGKIKKDIFNP